MFDITTIRRPQIVELSAFALTMGVGIPPTPVALRPPVRLLSDRDLEEIEAEIEAELALWEKY